MTERSTSGRLEFSCTSSLPEREYPSSTILRISTDRVEKEEERDRCLVFSSTWPWQLPQRWCAVSLMESAQAPLHRLRPHEGLQHHPEGLRPDHGAEERQQVTNINREGEKLLQSTRQSAVKRQSTKVRTRSAERRWPWWSVSAARTLWRGSATRRTAWRTSRSTAGSRFQHLFTEESVSHWRRAMLV